MPAALARPRPAQALTLAALHAWAAMTGQHPWEQAERQRLVAQMASTSLLTVLPKGLTIDRDLGFFGCRSLAELPAGLTVDEDLDPRECALLAGDPAGLTVGGSLYLLGCASLSVLPAGLTVGGDLYLSGCSSLRRLPAELTVDGDMYLSGCNSLTGLPAWLTVDGDLDLYGCTSLSMLPAGLRVGGDLDLGNCTSLTVLPDELTVDGDLGLGDCTSLTVLPAGLRVGGDLDLGGCTSLTELPEAVLRWPPRSDGQPHCINITDSGISPAVVASLAVGEGVQVVFDFLNLEVARAFWQSLLEGEPATDGVNSGPQPIAAQPHELRNLLDFLARLRDTADFRKALTRPLLACRALDLLHRMQGSPEVAAMCHERIGEALESCGDRVIWAMNQLELALRVREAQTSTAPETALRSLGIAMLRLEVVHRHAADRCTELDAVDPIEVYLAYETALAGPLQLPVSAQEMLYARLSQVTDGDLELARQAATRAGEDARQVEVFLSAWEPWRVHLRRTDTADVEGVWRALVPVPAPMPVADDDRCAFTLESLAELRAGDGYPVAIASAGGHWQLYDLASLLVWYREHGTHPIDADRPLRLKDIYSLPTA